MIFPKIPNREVWGGREVTSSSAAYPLSVCPNTPFFSMYDRGFGCSSNFLFGWEEKSIWSERTSSNREDLKKTRR